MFSLKGKTAVVTGASRGIGKEIALTLASAGAQVIVTSRNLEKLNGVKQKIESFGGTATAIQADMGDLKRINAFFAEIVERFSKLDLLINNAGTTVLKRAFDILEEDWDNVLNTNLKGLFFASQAAAKLMKETGGGKIVNIASVLGAVGEELAAPYIASKGGVIQLTKALALEWSRFGIQVNAVGPGYVKTEINAELLDNEKAGSHIRNKIPMRRLGSTKEVASGVLYLCSDEASYITGQTLFIDGGWLAQ
ncbi:2-deoxy-D-gluconate 3-dehydrogenase [Pueribacillus theae]|uniref:2-deoxy-D-gluconate 3-dehydrogenase n=1 Tax=Pueribacillus theae TaxID=2171751 RepID=A0A2U1K6J4_9BACI|nr:glucose 1-dehydrogenase [Pueribacillus theae]PWA12789.1 2-deoxy-D-gluconate 3-dehydrogenase [Pueribacillus theae]